MLKEAKEKTVIYKKGGMTGCAGVLLIIPKVDITLIILCNYWIAHIP